MKPFNKVAIIGVGLLGGSIALALKKQKLAKEIIGFGRHLSSLRQAKRRKLVDKITLDLKRAVSNVDLVVLATPAGKIGEIGKKIVRLVKPRTIIIDVGSTKKEIVSQINKVLPKEIFFVGCHPMAGSEKKGSAYAQAGLFKGALCFLTPEKGRANFALRRVQKLWQALGAKIRIVSPVRHDALMARVSHLPHLTACALVNLVGKDASFAASGFRDTTRIASSDPEMWVDICISNRKEIVRALNSFSADLERLKKAIAQKEKSKIFHALKQAKKLRDGFQK
jgi:prephenate dehydrogenase